MRAAHTETPTPRRCRTGRRGDLHQGARWAWRWGLRHSTVARLAVALLAFGMLLVDTITGRLLVGLSVSAISGLSGAILARQGRPRAGTLYMFGAALVPAVVLAGVAAAAGLAAGPLVALVALLILSSLISERPRTRGVAAHLTIDGRPKVAYRSAEEARTAARRHERTLGGLMNHYRCRECRQWHIGHRRQTTG
jgi:MFS family permease